MPPVYTLTEVACGHFVLPTSTTTATTNHKNAIDAVNLCAVEEGEQLVEGGEQEGGSDQVGDAQGEHVTQLPPQHPGHRTIESDGEQVEPGQGGDLGVPLQEGRAPFIFHAPTGTYHIPRIIRHIISRIPNLGRRLKKNIINRFET